MRTHQYWHTATADFDTQPNSSTFSWFAWIMITGRGTDVGVLSLACLRKHLRWQSVIDTLCPILPMKIQTESYGLSLTSTNMESERIVDRLPIYNYAWLQDGMKGNICIHLHSLSMLRFLCDIVFRWFHPANLSRVPGCATNLTKQQHE